ncbi:MAG: response regulator [Lachnospiraceae bacterium]|nr:response regulator [Lachnospiraceae bacterium]
MNNKTNQHLTVILVVTIAVLGLMVESILMNWEYWMLPVLLLGIILLWVMHIRQYNTEEFRENYYLGFAMTGTFFHGVHDTSFFDVVVIILLLMITFSLLYRAYMLNFILIEYAAIMFIQFYGIYRNPDSFFDSTNISRLFLHVASALMAFFVCKKLIREKQNMEVVIDENERRMEAIDKDTEDFLTNISHELRTPVNVVNGISSLILKKEQRDDVLSIKEAGLRLFRQIEDIQDYTEIIRNQILLEEDSYIITSLMNDVMKNLKLQETKSNVEIVVDLDPNVPMMMKGDIKKLQKILRHLVDNAIKFTDMGGVYIRVFAIQRAYGVNLNIEVSDTGKGMTRKDIALASKGMYQANKERDRSSGGIGIGLNVVYGFVHEMNGFVKIESEQGFGTKVLASIPQKVVDATPCLSINHESVGDVLFHVRTEKFTVPKVREYYRNMALNMAKGLDINLYSASNIREIRTYIEELNVTHIFMGIEEYEENAHFFQELSKSGITVAVSADVTYQRKENGGVIIMPKPLYGFPVVRVFNGEKLEDEEMEVYHSAMERLAGVRALVVDDEPMNLVVATGLFHEYGMEVDTAESGADAIEKFLLNEYDVIFMDHMMPGMDGVTAMKKLKKIAVENQRKCTVIALTANTVSGARKMFIEEGFDGFISKPIDTHDFERVMQRVVLQNPMDRVGGEA